MNPGLEISPSPTAHVAACVMLSGFDHYHVGNLHFAHERRERNGPADGRTEGEKEKKREREREREREAGGGIKFVFCVKEGELANG